MSKLKKLEIQLNQVKCHSGEFGYSYPEFQEWLKNEGIYKEWILFSDKLKLGWYTTGEDKRATDITAVYTKDVENFLKEK